MVALVGLAGSSQWNDTNEHFPSSHNQRPIWPLHSCGRRSQTTTTANHCSDCIFRQPQQQHYRWRLRNDVELDRPRVLVTVPIWKRSTLLCPVEQLHHFLLLRFILQCGTGGLVVGGHNKVVWEGTFFTLNFATSVLLGDRNQSIKMELISRTADLLPIRSHFFTLCNICKCSHCKMISIGAHQKEGESTDVGLSRMSF